MGNVELGTRLVGETVVVTDVGVEATDVGAEVTDVVSNELGVVFAGVAVGPGVTAARGVMVAPAARAGPSTTTDSTATVHSTAATRGRCTPEEPPRRLEWQKIPTTFRLPRPVPSVTRPLVMAETTGCPVRWPQSS